MSLDLPPRPSLSVPSQTLRFLRDPFSLLDEAVEECGDIFRLRILGLGSWVFLCSPALIKEMFKAPADILVAGEINRKQLGWVFGSNASFSLDGAAHRERVRIVHPQLNGPNVQAHIGTMRDVMQRAIDSWPDSESFAFLPRAHRISLDVMVHAMFGRSSAERRFELAELFDRFAAKGLRSPIVAMPFLQIDLGSWSPWGRFLALRNQVLDAYRQEIEGRLAEVEVPEGEVPEIIAALIAGRQRDGGRLDLDALLSEVLVLLFAGHETTGSILTWTLECILSHPEVEERLRSEVREVVGESPVGPEHLQRLPYLDAVLNESIRHRPIAPMAGIRLAKQDYEIGGYRIAEGSIVTQGFPAMARRSDLFHRPGVFDPEHFFERKMKPFEWNPFGGGTRMCLGRGLAEVELKVAVATLLQRVILRLDQPEVRPVRHGFFFAPNHGLRVALEERRPRM